MWKTNIARCTPAYAILCTQVNTMFHSSENVHAWWVEQFLKTESVVSVQHNYQYEFKLKRHKKVPEHWTILGPVTAFHNRSSAKDKWSPGRQSTIQIPQNIKTVHDTAQQSLRCSAHKQSCALQIPRTSLCPIMLDDLGMHPYQRHIYRN